MSSQTTRDSQQVGYKTAPNNYIRISCGHAHWLQKLQFIYTLYNK